MQKLLAVAALILTSIVTAHYVFADDVSDRPNGVDAKNWIKVSDRMGFVFESNVFLGGDRQILLAKQLRIDTTPRAASHVLRRCGLGHLLVHSIHQSERYQCESHHDIAHPIKMSQRAIRPLNDEPARH